MSEWALGTGTSVALSERLQRVIESATRDRSLVGIVVRLERDDDPFTWTGAAGEARVTTPFFIASATKLFTTAIVLRLVERGRLSLDDRLVDCVDPELVRGLHVHRGTDHTQRITIRQLLSHTSGLPDYFLGRSPTGESLERSLRNGIDIRWTLDDVLGTARAMGPVFPPGRRGKARYSDTNFQLLGRVIEDATGQSYEQTLATEVLEPLALTDTWLYTDANDERALGLRDGSRPLHIPMAMTSFGPDGGIVATVRDLMTFLRGFFEGRLFDAVTLPSLATYNRIFFPLQYGVGYARFRLPRIMSPLVAPPELLGHSGLSGAFAFHAVDRHVYLAGTVNDIARPDRSFRLMLRLLDEVRRATA